jgi:hypothetical protein
MQCFSDLDGLWIVVTIIFLTVFFSVAKTRKITARLNVSVSTTATSEPNRARGRRNHFLLLTTMTPLFLVDFVRADT